MSSICRSTAQGMNLPQHFTSNVLSFLSPILPLAAGSLKHGIRNPMQPVIFNSCKTITTLREPPQLNKNFLASSAVKETVSMLQGYGITEDDIIANPNVFRLPLNVIEQRLQYFSEGGIKTSVMCITDFDAIASSSLSKLRSNGLLAENKIFEDMVSCVEFENVPCPKIKIDPAAKYQDVHFEILSHVLNNKFGFSYPKWRRYYFASLCNTVQNITILRSMNLPFFWIRDHPTLTCYASAYNLTKLSEIDKKYSLPVSLNPLFRKDSDIAFVDHFNFLAILFLLKKYKICRHDVLKAKRLDFFLLCPETFATSMEKLVSNYVPSDDNQLDLLYKLNYLHPPTKRSPSHFKWLLERRRNPLTLHSEEVPVEGSWQHEMKIWLEAKDLVLKFAPCLHSYRTSPKVPIDADEESMKKLKTIINYIAAMLELPIDKVKSELSKIPHAPTVNVSVAKRTHKLLLGYGFSREDIKPCLHLLVYPREVVKETLEQKVLTDPVYRHKDFKSKHLQLCLYYILMKCNYGLYYK